jgi:hypothetical protein
VKRNPGQASRHDPGFRFAQSGLFPHSDDQLISLDPELRAGAVEVAFGEEGVEQRFRESPRAKIFEKQRAGVAWIGGGFDPPGKKLLRLRRVFCQAGRLSKGMSCRAVKSFRGFAIVPCANIVARATSSIFCRQ